MVLHVFELWWREGGREGGTPSARAVALCSTTEAKAEAGFGGGEKGPRPLGRGRLSLAARESQRRRYTRAGEGMVQQGPRKTEKVSPLR